MNAIELDAVQKELESLRSWVCQHVYRNEAFKAVRLELNNRIAAIRDARTELARREAIDSLDDRVRRLEAR